MNVIFLDFDGVLNTFHYLVKTTAYSKDPSEEGLLEKHKSEIKRILELENTKKTRLH